MFVLVHFWFFGHFYVLNLGEITIINPCKLVATRPLGMIHDPYWGSWIDHEEPSRYQEIATSYHLTRTYHPLRNYPTNQLKHASFPSFGSAFDLGNGRNFQKISVLESHLFLQTGFIVKHLKLGSFRKRRWTKLGNHQCWGSWFRRCFFDDQFICATTDGKNTNLPIWVNSSVSFLDATPRKHRWQDIRGHPSRDLPSEVRGSTTQKFLGETNSHFLQPPKFTMDTHGL